MDKKSFILYLDRKKEIDMLTNEQCGVLFKAIFEYAYTGNVPEIPDLAVSILLSFLITQIDTNAAKWEETKKKRSEAGKRGGAPIGNQNASNKQNKQKQAKTNTNKQKQAKQAVTVTVTDTVTGTVTVSDNIKAQDCPALEGAAQPAPVEEDVISWDELDPDLYDWAD